ncbi:MAG: hypothetical protein GWP19_09945 [Planctomycetia bacterium]|nr:hypothetical protein [Planctomycetia bacterium]
MSKMFNILFFILVTFVTAQDYSGYAGNYFHNGTDARSIAMGNALTAGTELNYPAYFNPAGVATVAKKKLLFTHQFLSLDRRQSVISFTMPLPPVGGISVGWISAGVNDIDGRNLAGVHTKDLNASEDAVLITFGIAPIKRIKVGGTVKILQNQLPNIDKNIVGKGVGFDFGVLYKFTADLNFAFVIKNINSAYQWSNKLTDDLGRIYKDKFPVQVRTGIQYKINSVIIVGDVGSYLTENKLLGLDYRIGTEYSFNDNYFFRTGYRNNRLAFGVGLKYNQLDKFTSLIDYTFVIEPVAGLTHIISYAINF